MWQKSKLKFRTNSNFADVYICSFLSRGSVNCVNSKRGGEKAGVAEQHFPSQGGCKSCGQ